MWKLLPAASSLLILAAVLGAHQYHFATAEANWDTRARTIEVIAKMHADDLEALLAAREQRRIELDRDPQAGQLACAYTLRQLEFAGVRLQCLGLKVSKHFAEVYLEGRIGALGPPLLARHQAFTALFSDQINSLQLQRDGKPAGPPLTFSAREGWKRLSWVPARP